MRIAKASPNRSRRECRAKRRHPTQNLFRTADLGYSAPVIARAGGHRRVYTHPRPRAALRQLLPWTRVVARKRLVLSTGGLADGLRHCREFRERLARMGCAHSPRLVMRPTVRTCARCRLATSRPLRRRTPPRRTEIPSHLDY